jgi:Uma2 family endonuclease
MERALSAYLTVGVPLVWVVNPLSRIVYVYRSDGSIVGLREQQEISGEDVVPGFRCRVAEFFPVPEEPTPAS